MSVKNMNSGDGETSYANNSAFQKVVMTKTWRVLDETLKDMLTTNEYEFTKCMKMADLGCSSGPNTLLVISHIIEQLSENKHVPKQLEVFLNDLPDNDFNNLFKLMSTNTKTNTNTKNNTECYIYGAPGSFYGRLFPSNSLHFAYSTSSIHWLSQIPQGLGKSNKENIYLTTTSPPQVFEAYSNQFERDFTTFLKLRGEEIRGGGRMVLGLLGRSVADPTSKDEFKPISLLAETLSDMVAEGLVKEEDLHPFNIPIYASSIQEIKTAIQSEGSFNLDKMEVALVALDANEDYNNHDNMVSDKNNNMSSNFVANFVRAFTEPMLAAHFGSSINVDAVFDVYAKKMDEHFSVEGSSYFTPVISLTRKTMTD